MVEANSKANQNKITEFVKDEIVYFAIGNQYYNGLVQTNVVSGKTVTSLGQPMGDLMQANVDCENLFKYLCRYDTVFRRFVPEDENNEDPAKETFKDKDGKAFNCYILINKGMEYIVKCLKVIRDYIKEQEKKGKKIFLISLMAGHGMIHNNDQVLLCNKLTKNRWYEMVPIEQIIRCIGAEQDNLYAITLFACCRQKYDPALCKAYAKGSA